MNFIAKHIEPCTGTPVHILTCGHTVSVSFLHPKKSSKCAPNCKAVDLITEAEPWFLCPICWESTLHAQFHKFKSRAQHMSETDKTIDNHLRAQHHQQDYMGDENTFLQWHRVQSGRLSFQKAVQTTYKSKVEDEGFRGCKFVTV
ncbi:hypothetical protein PTMSG1_04420 [Pyrenophora teres f. maculata]|nr:hypothetical protein PTMSG1_04420 [Pyrenophora teres f. maculata]